MTTPLREHLLGFLVGALDEPEQSDVEQQLKTNPQLRHELEMLRRKLSPLDAAREQTVPCDLAKRTCTHVFSQVDGQSSAPNTEDGVVTASLAATTSLDANVAEPVSLSASNGDKLGRSGRGWRPTDLFASISIAVIATVVLIPMIQQSRIASLQRTCAKNLRELGFALTEFSENRKGRYPSIPLDGNRNVAGIYAPTLLDGGYLNDYRVLVCPSSGLAKDTEWTVPTLVEIDAASGERLKTLQMWMGGSYGYSLGYLDNGKLVQPVRNGLGQRPIMSDAPEELCDVLDPASSTRMLPDLTSLNHCRGQNVLFEDNHVRYVTTCTLGGSEDIFLNRDRRVAAGLDEHDFVIGRSNATPVTLISAP